LNHKISVEAHSNRFGEESSIIYHDVFYQNLSGVCNALDNVETLRYSDKICIFFKKQLLES
jgi:ubiquitin-activating enzyme E1